MQPQEARKFPFTNRYLKQADGRMSLNDIASNTQNRRGGPKVRTGCITCRSRRVKCGEEKPGCLRCQKYGVVCQGYQRPDKNVGKSNSRTLVVRPIVPNIKPGTGVVQLLQVLLPGTSFKSEREWRYFRHFCDGFAGSISGPFKTALWQRSIPQASELKPFIRSAAVALGALSLSRITMESDDQGSNADQNAICPHEAYATSQYVKALEGMRKELIGKPHDNRQTLLACILVFCYESLQGNQASASIHASGGLNVINRLNPVSLGVGQRDYFNYPLNEGTEDEDLYTAFSALDIQTLHFIDTRDNTTHKRLKSRLTEGLSSMPSEFKSVQEAVRYWHVILRRNCHFVATARAEVSALRNANIQSQSEAGEDTKITPGNNPWSSVRVEPVDIPAHLVKEQRQCMSDIRRFGEVAEPIFAQQRAASPGDEYQMSLIVRIQMAMNTMSLVYCFFPPHHVWDEYQSTFESVIDLVPRLLPYIRPSSPSSSSSSPSSQAPHAHNNPLLFRFEIGILPATSLTANFCRQQPTRDQALALLASLGEYREGIWDAMTVYQIAKWLRDTEEPWRDEDGVLPANRRLIFEAAEINIKKKMVTIRAWQGDGTERGIEWKEGFVQW